MRNLIPLSTLLLFCLIQDCHSLHPSHKAQSCYATGYQYSTLAVTWLGEYCSENNCATNWNSAWNGKTFFIHGYWPSSYDLSYLNCMKYPYKNDPFCFTAFNYNQNLLNKTLLNKYWPQIGTIQNFWKYQWQKHGNCYLNLVLQDYDGLNNSKIFQLFFSGTVNKFKQISALSNVGKGRFQNKSDLAKTLKINQNQFYTVCFGDDELDQIRICFERGEPGRQKMTSCYRPPKECQQPFYLKDYEA